MCLMTVLLCIIVTAPNESFVDKSMKNVILVHVHAKIAMFQQFLREYEKIKKVDFALPIEAHKGKCPLAPGSPPRRKWG